MPRGHISKLLLNRDYKPTGAAESERQDLYQYLDQISDAIGGGAIQQSIKANPYNAVGTGGVVNDTAPQVSAWADSAADGVAIFYPEGTYTLGIAGSEDAPIVIGDGQGPIIIGTGYGSFIQRTEGYGNPDEGGLAGGGGYRLINMADGEAVADHMRIEKVRIGVADPEEFEVGGQTMNLRCRFSVFRDIFAYQSKGIFWALSAEDTLVDGLMAERAHIQGGACLRVQGWAARVTIVNFNMTSADDTTFVTVKEDDHAFDDVDDVIFRDVIYANGHSNAGQGSMMGVLCGGKKANLRGSHVNTAKIRAGGILDRMEITDPAAHPAEVGQVVQLAGFLGFGGLTAGEINGDRTVVGIDGDTENRIYTVQLGGSADAGTADEDIGSANTGTSQSLRITTSAGSPIVTVLVPNHGLTTRSGRITFTGWQTVDGITAAHVAGNRAVTVLTEHTVSFTAGGNASAGVTEQFAAAGVSVGFGMRQSAQRITFANIRGSSGDGALTGHGGTGIKIFGSENADYPLTVNFINTDTISNDTVDKPNMRVLACLQPTKIDAYRQILRSAPREAMIFAPFINENFPVHPDSYYHGTECEFEAPNGGDNPLQDWPTVHMGGGGLHLRGGRIQCGLLNALIAADDHATADTPIVATLATCPYVILEGVTVYDIPTNGVALKLGNVQRGLIDKNCQFLPATGVTTYTLCSMRTGTASGVDLGTNNVIWEAPIGACTTPFSNWQYGKGNVFAPGGDYGWRLLENNSLTVGQSSMDFTDVELQYCREVRVVVFGAQHDDVGTQRFQLRLSAVGSASFAVLAYDNWGVNDGPGVIGCHAAAVANTVDLGIFFEFMNFANPPLACNWRGQGSTFQTETASDAPLMGRVTTNQAHDGIRFQVTGGAFVAGGLIQVYGKA